MTNIVADIVAPRVTKQSPNKQEPSFDGFKQETAERSFEDEVVKNETLEATPATVESAVHQNEKTEDVAANQYDDHATNHATKIMDGQVDGQHSKFSEEAWVSQDDPAAFPINFNDEQDPVSAASKGNVLVSNASRSEQPASINSETEAHTDLPHAFPLDGSSLDLEQTPSEVAVVMNQRLNTQQSNGKNGIVQDQGGIDQMPSSKIKKLDAEQRPKSTAEVSAPPRLAAPIPAAEGFAQPPNMPLNVSMQPIDSAAKKPKKNISEVEFQPVQHRLSEPTQAVQALPNTTRDSLTQPSKPMNASLHSIAIQSMFADAREKEFALTSQTVSEEVAALEASGRTLSRFESNQQHTLPQPHSQRPDVLRQVIVQIGRAGTVVNGETIQIKLSPEELGIVKYRILPGDASHSIIVSAERPETLDLLRRNSDQLFAEFSGLGFNSIDLSFDENGEESFDTEDEDFEQSKSLDVQSIEENEMPKIARIVTHSGIDIRI